MGLGCIVYTAPEVYDFDWLLMEEERLVGLKVCIYAVACIHPYLRSADQPYLAH